MINYSIYESEEEDTVLFFPSGLVVLVGLIILNSLGVNYGLDDWSPFRLIPNLAVVFIVFSGFIEIKGH